MLPFRKQLANFFILDGGPSRNAAMEGLRGYAVLLVVFIHAVANLCFLQAGIDANDPSPIWTYAQNHSPGRVLLHLLCQGHYAVDLFFLLSAFLITRIVARHKGEFSYAGYMKKRVLRIYPPFLAALVFAIAVQHYVVQEIPIKKTIIVQNLMFMHGMPIIGYHYLSYNYPAWSLFYEVSFYMIFPLLFALWRRSQSDSGSARSYMAGVVLFAAVLYIHAYMPRAGTFFFGIMLGLRSDDELRKIARGLPTWLVAGVFGALCLGYATYSRNFAWFTPFFSVSISMLFLKACYDEGPLQRLFTWKPLRAAGNMSYSLYLMHMPMMLMLDQLIPYKSLGPNHVVRSIAYIGLNVAGGGAAGLLLYAIVERRYFRRRTQVPAPHEVPEPLRLAA